MVEPRYDQVQTPHLWFGKMLIDLETTSFGVQILLAYGIRRGWIQNQTKNFSYWYEGTWDGKFKKQYHHKRKHADNIDDLIQSLTALYIYRGKAIRYNSFRLFNNEINKKTSKKSKYELAFGDNPSSVNIKFVINKKEYDLDTVISEHRDLLLTECANANKKLETLQLCRTYENKNLGCICIIDISEYFEEFNIMQQIDMVNQAYNSNIEKIKFYTQ